MLGNNYNHRTSRDLMQKIPAQRALHSRMAKEELVRSGSGFVVGLRGWVWPSQRGGITGNALREKNRENVLDWKLKFRFLGLRNLKLSNDNCRILNLRFLLGQAKWTEKYLPNENKTGDCQN